MKMCLDGIRILELSHYIAAPYCGQLLADMGADVIKVERPGAGNGDAGREYEPKLDGESLYYASYNRNKRTITLDIKSAEGREIFKRLIEEYDIVLENYRPGVLDRLGLGFADLCKVNPQLIMTSVSGFGQYGPYKNRQALDMAIQAMSGFMDVTGFPEGPPVKGGPVISDFVAALYGALGTVLAVYHREKTGMGQHVDIALLDCMFTLLENYPSIYLLTGEETKRSGNGRPFSAPTDTYQAKDGYIHISAPSDNLFCRLMKLVGRPEMINDPGLAGPLPRKQREAEINGVVRQWLAGKTVAEAGEELDKAGIPNGPVYTVAQITDHPQIRARDMVIEFNHSAKEQLPLIGNPVKMSRTSAKFRIPPARQGQYNEEVYSQVLHLSEEELAALKAKNII